MFVFLCIFTCLIVPFRAEEILDVEPAVERQRLRSDLLKNYHKDQRPVKEPTDVTTVSVFYRIQHILGLDEKSQILSLKGQLAVSWTDQYLTWDPNNYNGVTYIRLSPEDVWLPHVHAPYSVIPEKQYDKDRSPPVVVFSNGTMQWCPQVRYDIPCSADYKHYPFDSHDCSLLLVIFSYYADLEQLSSDWRPFSQSEEVQGTEWALHEVIHDVIEEPGPIKYQILNITITLERVSRIYRYVCVIPTIVSMVTILGGFWLLASEATRYVIGCANVIVLSMLLQHLAATVPAGSIIPLIAQYSASCLCLSAIFVVIAVISNLIREANGTAPSVLLRWAHFTLDNYLCVFTFSHVSSLPLPSEHASSNSTMSSPDEQKRRRDWHLISVLVDRLAFWCFALIFAVLLTVLAAI